MQNIVVVIERGEVVQIAHDIKDAVDLRVLILGEGDDAEMRALANESVKGLTLMRREF